MKLTKTGYKQYLACPKEFWLRRQMPELFPREENIARDHLGLMGYRLQRLAEELFSKGGYGSCEFEKGFETEQLFAKVDIFTGDSMYEVKLGGSIKEEYIDDITFQKIVAEMAGTKINRAFLIYVNKEYVREGEIDPEKLLRIDDVTEQVNAKTAETKIRISQALEYLESEPDKTSIIPYCKNKLECLFIRQFHDDLPEYSIFDINKISNKNLDQLISDGILDIKDVSDKYKLSDLQRKQVEIARAGKIQAAENEIKELLNALEFPIYFLDYETANPAIPVYEGFRPFEVITFQFSLHVLHEDGELKHFEFLSDGTKEPSRDLLVAMRDLMGDQRGTVVVWSSYENTRNNEMKKRHLDFSEFLDSVGGRIFDLMGVFSKGLYVDPKFKGKPSIKTVLPVMIPELNYEHLQIKEGSTASAIWLEMIDGAKTPEEREGIRTDLLNYCALDTEAMYKIMSVLREKFC